MEEQRVTASRAKKDMTRLQALFRKEHSTIVLVIIALVLILTFATPNFATGRNILNVLLQLSVVAFMALGLTFVLVAGGIDLSVAGVLTLSGVLGSSVMIESGSTVLGIAVMLAIGIGAGIINGFAIARLRMVPFIVTLSMWVITEGIAAWYTQGVTVGPIPEVIYQIGRRNSFILPIPFLMVGAWACLLFFVLQRTIHGRHIYATGANIRTSRASGIRTTSVVFSTYVASGICASLAGFTLVARLGVASSGMGGDLMILDAISAVIIGGASLTGGRGSIMGTLWGVLIISLISNGLNLFGVSYFLTIIVKGIVIFLAVWIDAMRTHEAR